MELTSLLVRIQPCDSVTLRLNMSEGCWLRAVIPGLSRFSRQPAQRWCQLRRSPREGGLDWGISEKQTTSAKPESSISKGMSQNLPLSHSFKNDHLQVEENQGKWSNKRLATSVGKLRGEKKILKVGHRVLASRSLQMNGKGSQGSQNGPVTERLKDEPEPWLCLELNYIWILQKLSKQEWQFNPHLGSTWLPKWVNLTSVDFCGKIWAYWLLGDLYQKSKDNSRK